MMWDIFFYVILEKKINVLKTVTPELGETELVVQTAHSAARTRNDISLSVLTDTTKGLLQIKCAFEFLYRTLHNERRMIYFLNLIKAGQSQVNH